ncbi:MAG TPA: hypothetical protein VK131_12420, partial [Candidatus Acidoferrales bacterium]|nr:hypothetical protein [Candidatus Acidoferrales bacterium]
LPVPGVPSPPGPAQHFDVVATERDSGSQLSLRVGQTLELVLAAPKSFQPWQGVQIRPPGVLAPIPDTAATAARGVTVAAFRAAGPGSTEISAYSEPDCPANRACPAIVAVFNLKVVVT